MDILYSFRRCPYAIRARMALLVAGAPFVLREVVLRDKPEALIAASPKATVPVLVTVEGVVIDQSLAIMHRALAGHDPEDWMAGNDAALIAVFDDRFKHHLDRYKYPERHGGDAALHRAVGLDLLALLEARLARHDGLVREQPGLADIAIMPFVRQFVGVEPEWFAATSLFRLRGWLERHLASPLFAQAMLRVPPWRPGDVPVVMRGGDA